MAFPNGWGRKCELIIQASKVAETLTNFPVFLMEDNLPSEMFDADGSYPALADGGDIRFSSDSAGSTRLACEIVRFVIDNDPANGIAEIHVNVASISSSVDTSIYVWYDKPGESQPGVAETYGRNATWNSGYKSVWHFDEDEGNRIDSTGNSEIDSGAGVGFYVSQTPGPVGRGDAYSGGYLNCTEPTDPEIGASETFCFSLWLKTHVDWSNPQDTYFAVGDSYPDFDIQSNGYVFPGMYWRGIGYLQPSAPDRNIDDEVWHFVNFTRTGTTITVYVDGANSQGTITAGNTWETSPGDYWIGGDSSASFWYGSLDEMRLCDVARTANYILSEYNNQNDPATFILEQTPSGSGSATYKLDGITKDKNGSVLGSCECYVFKDNLDNTLTYKGYALSNAGTGAYSVTGTGLTDDDSNYIVIGWKDDTPHIFDVSDHVLQPVVV